MTAEQKHDKRVDFAEYLINFVLDFRQKARECGAYKTSDEIREKFKEYGYGNLIRDERVKS